MRHSADRPGSRWELRISFNKKKKGAQIDPDAASGLNDCPDSRHIPDLRCLLDCAEHRTGCYTEEAPIQL